MLRIAKKEDIKRIAEIALFTNRYNFKSILSNDFLYKILSQEYLENKINESFEKIEYHVLEKENIIIGYFSINFLKNLEEECELINIAVDVPFQNQNYGKCLLDYCFELVKRMNKKLIKLEVFKKNLVPIKLYEKHGFEIEKQYFLEEWNQEICEYRKKI
jgi:ribosomal protein S18 acetylase RimI-like enzyme